jgi:hypothetical protein
MYLLKFTVLLSPLSVIGSAQVNLYAFHPFHFLCSKCKLIETPSYYDTACQQYAGTSFAELGQGAVGGPAGSKSMLFVGADQCFDTCGRKWIPLYSCASVFLYYF